MIVVAEARSRVQRNADLISCASSRLLGRRIGFGDETRATEIDGRLAEMPGVGAAAAHNRAPRRAFLVRDRLELQIGGARTHRGDGDDHHRERSGDKGEDARNAAHSQEISDEERRQDARKPAPGINEADRAGADSRRIKF